MGTFEDPSSSMVEKRSGKNRSDSLTTVTSLVYFFFFFFYKILFIFREGQGERKRNINVCLYLMHPLLGT